MIPKIIHYCWLSKDPIPEFLQKCMDSWKKFLPDYEFICWNFERFDKESSLWVKQAFECKKYAFAADYIRLYALYNYGGIYLDMDVEVVKSFDDFLDLKTMMCWQKDIGGLEVAAFGVEKGEAWLAKCLAYYDNRHFVKENGTFDMKTLPSIVESLLLESKYNLKLVDSLKSAIMAEKNLNTIPIFSCDFFSPKSYITEKLELTNNSTCIHHFAGSWLERTWYFLFEKKMWHFFGCRNYRISSRCVNKFIQIINIVKNKLCCH